MASRNAERKEPVTRGTGNVFADLGFPDAAERQAKLPLAYALNRLLEARELSQADAAKVLGVTQPKVSALRNYKLAGFSVERLMNLLTAAAYVSAYGPRARACAGGELRLETPQSSPERVSRFRRSRICPGFGRRNIRPSVVT